MQDDQQNDFKPDLSDRAPQRERRNTSLRPTLSRQHIMIGVGVLVLLLLIILVSTALKAPPETATPATKEVSLPASSQPSAPTDGLQPVDANAPPISSSPTQSPVQPVNPDQQRIEIPGDVADALSEHQQQLNRLKETEMPSTTESRSSSTQQVTTPAVTTPAVTTPAIQQKSATVAPGSGHKNTTAVVNKPAVSAVKPAVNQSASHGSAAVKSGAIQSLPSGHFMLQVSSASRSDTLKAYASKQNLTRSWVYETRRNNQPWYVLVIGSYPSRAEAEKAISSLPADVQSKKPWVRSVRQVQQDQGK